MSVLLSAIEVPGFTVVWRVSTSFVSYLKNKWVERAKPNSIHDGEDPKAYVDDLEAAGATIVRIADGGHRIHVRFPGDAARLVQRASGDYSIQSEERFIDTNTEIALQPH